MRTAGAAAPRAAGRPAFFFFFFFFFFKCGAGGYAYERARYFSSHGKKNSDMSSTDSKRALEFSALTEADLLSRLPSFIDHLKKIADGKVSARSKDSGSRRYLINTPPRLYQYTCT